MSTKTKVIIIASVTLLISTSLVYLLYWRKRDGVSQADAEELSKYTIVEGPSDPNPKTSQEIWKDVFATNPSINPIPY